eukprot:6176371-Pleurochrysis_carterae.AAC.2
MKPLTQSVISRFPSNIAIKADYLAFALETEQLPFRPSRAPDRCLQTVVALTCVACVLAERSRSAPQILETFARDGHRRPVKSTP